MMNARVAFGMFALGLTPQLIVLTISLGVYDVPVSVWASRSDLPDFLQVARLIATGERPALPFVERMFLGWPLILAAVVGRSDAVAWAVGLGIVFAAGTTVFTWVYTRDRRAAVLTAVLLPAWILQSTLGMSEPAYLFSIMLSMVLYRQNLPCAAALAMGFAGLIRPTAVFAWAGVAADLAGRRATRREWAAWVILCGGVAGMTVPLNLALYGTPLRQFDQYSTLQNISPETRADIGAGEGGGHFGPPFRSLVLTPLQTQTPVWKVVYIWSQAVAVLVATAIAGLTVRGHGPDRVFAIWAVFNTAFILSTGPYWGFHSFDRYALWAMPAYIYAVCKYLPDRPVCLAGFAVLSITLALLGRSADLFRG